MKRWAPRNWNDVLSVLILVGLPAYWMLGNPSETIIGTTLGGWLLCAQYYWRKAPSESSGPQQ